MAIVFSSNAHIYFYSLDSQRLLLVFGFIILLNFCAVSVDLQCLIKNFLTSFFGGMFDFDKMVCFSIIHFHFVCRFVCLLSF